MVGESDVLLMSPQNPYFANFAFFITTTSVKR